MPNSVSCKKNSRSVSLQCQAVTYFSLSQMVIGILGHNSRCAFRLYFLYRCAFASNPQHLPLVSSLDQASVPIWHLSTSLCLPLPVSLFLSLSPIQPAVSGRADGDEEGRWGQRYLAMPPSVHIVQLSRHRVATAEVKLQTESGEMKWFLLSVWPPHFCCYSKCQYIICTSYNDDLLPIL